MASQGSFGHPALCRPACVQVAKGRGCRLSFSCGFCHLEHGKRTRLDKLQRLLLKEADEGQRVELLLPHLLGKLKQMGPEVEELVHLLPRGRHLSSEFLQQAKFSKIHRSFQRMRLSDLLDLLPLDEGLVKAVNEVRQKLFVQEVRSGLFHL